jgi:hypothetical protein
MGVGDIRYTVLQAVNEAQRKLGLNETALNANKLSAQLVDFVNDVCDDLSDYGNWHETLVSAVITAASGQSDYSIATSGNVKNIGDVFFQGRTGPLRALPVDQMRLLTRVTSDGTPSQFSIVGTDANGNPNIRFRPRPGASEDGKLFSVLYWQRAPRYTTSDSASVIPFPARVVVLGVIAKQILNESGGSPTDKYTQVYQQYLVARKESLNRFNGDTGFNVVFRPWGGRRRR